MNIVEQSCDYADCQKVNSPVGKLEEITSSLYNNNHAVLRVNSNKVRPTTLL